MTTARRTRRRLFALAVGLVLALVVPEVAYRLWRVPALSPTTNPSYVEHDDELGWRYIPGAHARHVSDEFAVEVAINAQGFRGPDWPATKRGPRVLILGDSFAFGWGVAWEDGFAARLQAAHPDWDVLDAAVSGYATDQELLLLRRLLPSTKPDVVVSVFCSNDLWESSTDVAYGKHKPRFVDRAGVLELTGVPVPRAWPERISAVWRAWQKSAWERRFLARSRDRAREWELVCDLYRTMRDELAGVPLVIVSDSDRLAGFALEERGVEHVDVRSIFHGATEPVLFPRDGHWNANGHARVARELETRLLTRLASAASKR